MTTPSSPKSTVEARPEDEALLNEVQFLRGRIAELEGAAVFKSTASEDLDARSDALAERVKELKCLYAISSLLKGHHDLGDILQKVVDVLPSAWQYPELACASITLKSRRYQTKDFREPEWRQQAEIVVGGEKVGVLELGYTGLVEDGREPRFLPEEETLLSTAAERIAEIIALKETENRLATYQQHLRSLASELTLTEERERRSLAISLHDRIGQGLAVVNLKIETLRQLLPGLHQPMVEDIAALIKQIVKDTRSLSFEISPSILYELGLKQAVAWLGDQMARQFGLRVEVHSDEKLLELTEGVRVMLYRSVQELLTNAAKHAQATRATVRLVNDADELCVIVEDDGVGFDVSSRSRYPTSAGGFGLFSIRERISHLGGRMEIESSSGKGTRIQLSVPSAEAVDTE